MSIRGSSEDSVTVDETAIGAAAARHPILSLPLIAVMRPEIALTLQHVLQLYTVGAFLNAWRSPKNHKSIEQVFDSPQQARHAAAVCATWLGLHTRPAHQTHGAWWAAEECGSSIDA